MNTFVIKKKNRKEWLKTFRECFGPVSEVDRMDSKYECEINYRLFYLLTGSYNEFNKVINLDDDNKDLIIEIREGTELNTRDEKVYIGKEFAHKLQLEHKK